MVRPAMRRRGVGEMGAASVCERLRLIDKSAMLGQRDQVRGFDWAGNTGSDSSTRSGSLLTGEVAVSVAKQNSML